MAVINSVTLVLWLCLLSEGAGNPRQLRHRAAPDESSSVEFASFGRFERSLGSDEASDVAAGPSSTVSPASSPASSPTIEMLEEGLEEVVDDIEEMVQDSPASSPSHETSESAVDDDEEMDEDERKIRSLGESSSLESGIVRELEQFVRNFGARRLEDESSPASSPTGHADRDEDESPVSFPMGDTFGDDQVKDTGFDEGEDDDEELGESRRKNRHLKVSVEHDESVSPESGVVRKLEQFTTSSGARSLAAPVDSPTVNDDDTEAMEDVEAPGVSPVASSIADDYDLDDGDDGEEGEEIRKI